MLDKMSSADLVQMKGWGSWLWASMYWRIARSSWLMLVWHCVNGALGE